MWRRPRVPSWSKATAEGIRRVAEAIKLPGGQEAVQLRVAEQYIGQFGELAKEGNTIVLALKSGTIPDRSTLAARAENIETRFGLPAAKWLRMLRTLPPPPLTHFVPA